MSTAGLVGVTTFLKQSLMGGAEFRRRFSGLRAKKGAGLCVGRATDTALNRHVSGVSRYSPANRRHARLGHIVRALRRVGIKLVRAQVPVAVKELGIHTTIDAVGTRGGALVVVELKCTTHARAQHYNIYDMRCSNRPTLANGLPNNELTHHQLQAGFGVAAVRKLVRCPVEGVVVVCYADAADVRAVPRRMCNTLLFACNARPYVGKRAGALPKAVPGALDTWPDEDTRVQDVVAAHGAESVERLPGDAVVLMSGGKPLLVAGCVASRWTSVSPRRRAAVVAMLLKCNTNVFGQTGATGHVHVLVPHDKHWRLRRVAKQFAAGCR